MFKKFSQRHQYKVAYLTYLVGVYGELDNPDGNVNVEYKTRFTRIASATQITLLTVIETFLKLIS